MSVSSTGLYGSATIVNSDLLNDVNPQVRPRDPGEPVSIT